jgi:hypothetical protein
VLLRNPAYQEREGYGHRTDDDNIEEQRPGVETPKEKQLPHGTKNHTVPVPVCQKERTFILFF